MPVYEYECESCGEKFELLRPIKDMDKEVTCPKCGSIKTHRLISNIASTAGDTSCAPSPTAG